MSSGHTRLGKRKFKPENINVYKYYCSSKTFFYPKLGYQYALYYILLSLYSRLRVMLYVQKRKRLQVNMNN